MDTSDLTKTSDNIRNEFANRDLGQAVYDELDQFLDAKAAYSNKETDKTDMLFWYEVLFTSLKAVWVNGGIPEADFWYLTDLLGE